MNSRQPSSRNDSWHDQSSNSQSPRRDFDDQSLQHKKSELNHDQQQQAWAIDAIANVLDGMNTSMNDDNTNFDITTMNDYQPRSDLQSAKHHERDVSPVRMSQQPSQWAYGNSLLAPSIQVNSNIAGLQPEHSIQSEASTTSTRYFRYVLGASTAVGSKHGYGSMTYLNQSQSYEIRLKRIADTDTSFGSMVRSTIRLSFIDRRLQYREKDEVTRWQSLHPRDRMLDLDLTLSYGIFEVNLDQKVSNWVEFTWDTQREASIFVRIACISTEFTSKKHGGERGVPLKLMVDTKTHNGEDERLLDTAFCQIKVFKSKGADRKHKTDRQKFDRNADSTKILFQPTYECTLFAEFEPDNDPHVEGQSESEYSLPDTYSGASDAHQQDTLSVPDSPQAIGNSESPPQPVSTLSTSSSDRPEDDSSEELVAWLIRVRFDRLVPLFCNYKYSDLKQLSKSDLIHICGPQDGIRLFNVIHKTETKPLLTIYVTDDNSGLYDLVTALSDDRRQQNESVFTGVYLECLTIEHLVSKLCEVLMVPSSDVQDCFIFGPGGIRIRATDQCIANLVPDSTYGVEYASENQCLYLRPVDCPSPKP